MQRRALGKEIKTLGRPGPRHEIRIPIRMGSRAAAPSPLDPTAASALVDTFFDALCHFGGERPAFEELGRVLAADAQIVEVERLAPEAILTETSRYARDAWLSRIAQASERLAGSGQGHFFDELERTISALDSQVRVGSVVEERVTRDARIEHLETLFCSLVVSEVNGEPSIVEVRVRRGSGLPPG